MKYRKLTFVINCASCYCGFCYKIGRRIFDIPFSEIFQFTPPWSQSGRQLQLAKRCCSTNNLVSSFTLCEFEILSVSIKLKHSFLQLLSCGWVVPIYAPLLLLCCECLSTWTAALRMSCSFLLFMLTNFRMFSLFGILKQINKVYMSTPYLICFRISLLKQEINTKQRSINNSWYDRLISCPPDNRNNKGE